MRSFADVDRTRIDIPDGATPTMTSTTVTASLLV